MPIWYYVSFFFSFWFILLFLLFHIFSLTTCTWRLLWYYTPDLVLWNSSNHKQQRRNDENILNDLKQTHKRTWSPSIPVVSHFTCLALLCLRLCWGGGDGWMSWRERHEENPRAKDRQLWLCAQRTGLSNIFTLVFLLHVFSSQHTDQRDFLCRFFFSS